MQEISKHRVVRIRVYILTFLALASFVAADAARADSESSQEYQVKAAFLYNFINFVDWPEEKLAESKDSITIGIIGKDPFGKAFEPIRNKQVKGKEILIRRFKGFEQSQQSGAQIEAMRKCHLLFICRSEKKQLREIINSVKGRSVLAVGDVAGFLESGGIINFLMEDKKVRFEINNTAAKQAKLAIRSKLLRLAKRVIGQETSDEAEN